MEKITSFTIDHIRLVPGVYVSRKDPIGNEIITTFDLRTVSYTHLDVYKRQDQKDDKRRYRAFLWSKN